MSYEKAKNYLEKQGLKERIQLFEESSATVELAAKRVGCTNGEIAKTLSFKLEDKTILIVTAGDVKIDNVKYKNEFNIKARMLEKDQVEKIIGHDVGGVCPFGINEGIDVYLDESLKRFEIVYPACGSENSAVGLTISEMDKYSNNLKWIDVCKFIEEQ